MCNLNGGKVGSMWGVVLSSTALASNAPLKLFRRRTSEVAQSVPFRQSSSSFNKLTACSENGRCWNGTS
ncbi:MAG: hypothetical protein ACKESB_03805 [Candidatus Hodgkinia cicadicola]